MLVIFERFNFHVQTIFTKSLSIFYEINVYTLYFLLTNWYHRIIKSESNNDYARPSSTACYTVRLVICGLTRRHSMQRQREREREKRNGRVSDFVAKWDALMNFLIKSQLRRATARYYYLSHRSIRRAAVFQDDLQITQKTFLRRTCRISVFYRYLDFDVGTSKPEEP